MRHLPQDEQNWVRLKTFTHCRVRPTRLIFRPFLNRHKGSMVILDLLFNFSECPSLTQVRTGCLQNLGKAGWVAYKW